MKMQTYQLQSTNYNLQPTNYNLKKVLLLGSGALKIGEAGEFDYSGSQAIKALKEEGIKVVLINPNIATIQTSEGMADSVYFVPVLPYFVQEVIRKEKPDGILLGFGGQTALNCGIELFKQNVLKQYKVRVLGTPVETIIATEDRKKFVEKMSRLGLFTPNSIAVNSVAEGVQAAKKIGFPVIMRCGFALGGAGSAVAKTGRTLRDLLEKALAVGPQVLIEEYLGGWKELEYEVVRDRFDNCITVCNMENMDPMGIHTGESIVVAPSQTLTNHEYFKLREVAIAAIRGLHIVGECNIQFAVNSERFAYRIIEVNARLSRSSALASKATGYPLALVAAKLALGYSLADVKNAVTGTTSAFFEPALDYVVVKIPRWDLSKFQAVHEEIGTEMKSVGEVMAIGRTFEEAIQKAVRSLNLDYEGIMPEKKELKKFTKKEVERLLDVPVVGRLNLIAIGLFLGITIDVIYQKTAIDRWFLHRINAIVSGYKELKKSVQSIDLLKKAKRLGFSDKQIGEMTGQTWKEIRSFRKKHGIIPFVKQIDTLAGEFPCQTNYLYCTYHADGDDVVPAKNKSIAVLGSGAYRIGSSVEFDWCAVSAALKLRELGYKTTVINCNPETVSTDYDISDKLYFEELTMERLLDIYDKEQFSGIVLSMGGQASNNLAVPCSNEGLPIIGTAATSIDRAEDRSKFSKLLDTLHISQPRWSVVSSEKKALVFAKSVGYPVLIRPSYVLSGTAMRVMYDKENLSAVLRTIAIDKKHPMVISHFIDEAEEIEVDAVAQKGKVIAYAILTHVEEAGVHSGDATIVLEKDNVTDAIAKRVEEITFAIVRALSITGPCNIQFLVKHDTVLVIECNVRSSRSFPFTSKVIGVNLIDLAVGAMMGKPITSLGRLIPHAVGVKAAQFSFGRLRGADPILHVEMASTGEVGCFGDDLKEAYLKALLSVGFHIPKKNILLTIGNYYKTSFLPYAKKLCAMGFKLFATEGTASYLRTFNIPARLVRKGYEGGGNTVLSYIVQHKVELVINLRDKEMGKGVRLVTKERTDGYLMRRACSDHHVSLLTNAKAATLLIDTILHKTVKDVSVEPWNHYL